MKNNINMIQSPNDQGEQQPPNQQNRADDPKLNKNQNLAAVRSTALLGDFFRLPNKFINLKNLNHIEKDPQHEIYRMYFRNGLVAPLTTEEFQIMNGSNPVQTHFCMSDLGTVNSVPSESLNQ